MPLTAEDKLIADAKLVAQALNKLSVRAKALNIEITVSKFYDSTRIDIDLKRTVVDFEYEIKGGA